MDHKCQVNFIQSSTHEHSINIQFHNLELIFSNSGNIAATRNLLNLNLIKLPFKLIPTSVRIFSNSVNLNKFNKPTEKALSDKSYEYNK